MDTDDRASAPPELCMELAFAGEAPLVYGSLDELPDLLRAMLGPAPQPDVASTLTFTLTQRAPASCLVSCQSGTGQGEGASA